MGIRNLNRYLSDNCSENSISKTRLNQFQGKTIVIDTSIYMYKFMSQNALLEYMYSLITILYEYKINPIFIFDGKSPPEKKELLKQRSRCKKDAEHKFNELKQELLAPSITENSRCEIISEMESLKKKFVRLRDEDIAKVKSLMDSLGAIYCDADGESDKLCALMVKCDIAWACLSDDMDMFVYGCTRVMRHFSLLKHTVILYDLDEILTELSLTLNAFRKITILSGTDYNIHNTISLKETISYYKEFQCLYKNDDEFYNWLKSKVNCSNYNIESLNKIYHMFDIDDIDIGIINSKHKIIQRKKPNTDLMKKILKEDGFVFT